MRIKIRSLKHRPDKVAAVQSLFDDLPAVIGAKASDITGSLLLVYDPDLIDPLELVALLRQNGYLRENAGRLVNRAAQPGVATRLTRTVGKAAVSWAVGKALESNGLGLLAALI
jgi:hypothetical protein